MVSFIGTVRYMSPEQTRSYEDIKPASDLYSLGMVAYEMLVGTSPFDDGASPLNVLSQIVSSENVRLPASLDVSDSLRRIIDRLLEKDLTLRYSSARSVIADLTMNVTDDSLPFDGTTLDEGALLSMEVGGSQGPSPQLSGKRTYVVLALAAMLFMPGLVFVASLFIERGQDDSALRETAVTVKEPEESSEPKSLEQKTVTAEVVMESETWDFARRSISGAIDDALMASRATRSKSSRGARPKSRRPERTSASGSSQVEKRPDSANTSVDDTAPTALEDKPEVKKGSFDHLVPSAVAKPKLKDSR